MERISIIIPTLNERGTIKEMIKKIFSLGIPGLEIIVVDDSSDDGTTEIVRALKKRYPIILILRPKKLGLGSALRDGLTIARSHSVSVAITMDGDLSHDPLVIPTMIEKLQEADVVVGSRRVKGGAIIGWGPGRALMSRVAMEMSRRILGIVAKDVTSGFRAYRRKVLEKIDLTRISSTGYAFQEEMLFKAQRAGFQIVEIPIVFYDRRHGKSKLGIRDILEFFITVIRLRLYA